MLAKFKDQLQWKVAIIRRIQIHLTLKMTVLYYVVIALTNLSKLRQKLAHPQLQLWNRYDRRQKTSKKWLKRVSF